MNMIRKISKNAGALLIADITSYFLGFFCIMYTARYLGVENFGILFFALAFTGIFAIFTNLGLYQLTIREVARDKSLAKKYLGNISVIKIFLVIATYSLIALTINLLGYPYQTVKVVYIVALSIVINAFTDMFIAVFLAFERMEFESFRKILYSASLLVGVLVAIRYDFSLIGFSFLYLLASALSLGFCIIISTWKFVIPKFEIDLGFWKMSIKNAIPFGLSIFFITIYYWTDTVMLSLLQGNAAVGWYNAASRLVLVLTMVPAAFTNSVFPLMSKFYITSQYSLKSIYEKLLKYMLITAVPIGIGTTILADKIILQIFGSEYMPSVIVLQILIWSLVLIFASNAMGRLFESSNKPIIVAKVTMICAMLNIILNLLLIPKYSYIGASVAAVITQACVLFLFFIGSLKIGYGISYKKLGDIAYKTVVSGVLMGIFIKYFGNLNLLVLIPLAAVLYFLILCILRGFDGEDKQLIRDLIKGGG